MISSEDQASAIILMIVTVDNVGDVVDSVDNEGDVDNIVASQGDGS